MASRLTTSVVISAQDRASSVFRNFGRQVQSTRQELSEFAGSLQAGLATAGISLGVTNLVTNAAAYEHALNNMQKVTDTSLSGIDGRIKSMDASLGSSTQLMEGYYQVISAGVTDTAASYALLETASRASKAAGVSQADTITALTKLMAGYAGDIKSVAEASDLMFAIEKQGQTSVQDLVPVIGNLASASKLAGITADEMGASFAAVTQTAGGTSEAATQYNAVLMGLINPTKDLGKVLDQLGFSSAQALFQHKGFTAGLQQITQAAVKSGFGLTDLFSSEEAVLALAPLMASGFKQIETNLDAMGSKAGSTSRAFETWRTEFHGALEAAKNLLANLGTLSGEKLLPGVTEGLVELNSGLSFLNGNFHEASQTATVFGSALLAWAVINKTSLIPSLNNTAEQIRYQNRLFGMATSEMGLVQKAAFGVKSGLKAMGSSFLSAFGGPVGLAVTGLAAGMTYLAMEETLAERVGRDHAEVLRTVGGSADQAAESMKGLADKFRDMSSLQLAAEANRAQEIIEEFQRNIRNDAFSITDFSNSEQDIAIRESLYAFKEAGDFSSQAIAALRGQLERLGLASKDNIDKIVEYIEETLAPAEAAAKILERATYSMEDFVHALEEIPLGAFEDVSSGIDTVNAKLDVAFGELTQFDQAFDALDGLTANLNIKFNYQGQVPGAEEALGKTINGYTQFSYVGQKPNAWMNTRLGSGNSSGLLPSGWLDEQSRELDAISNKFTTVGNKAADAGEKSKKGVSKIESATKSLHEELSRLTLTDAQFEKWKASDKVDELGKILGKTNPEVQRLQKLVASEADTKFFETLQKQANPVAAAIADVDKQHREFLKSVKDLQKTDPAKYESLMAAEAKQYAKARKEANTTEKERLDFQRETADIVAKNTLNESQYRAYALNENIRLWEEQGVARTDIDARVNAELLVANKGTTANMGDLWGEMYKDIQKAGSNAVYDWLDDGKMSFDSFADYGRKILAEIVNMYAINPIIMPIVAQVTGMGGGLSLQGGQVVAGGGGAGGGMGGGLGIGNLPISKFLPDSLTGGVSGLMNWTLPGTYSSSVGLTAGSLSTSALQNAGSLPSVGTFTGQAGGLGLGSMLGYGAMGGLGYSALGGALGLPQSKYSGLTSGVGGALGAWGGAALGGSSMLAGAAMGSWLPGIGTALGALAGGLLGGSLGGAPKTHPGTWMQVQNQGFTDIRIFI